MKPHTSLLHTFFISPTFFISLTLQAVNPQKNKCIRENLRCEYLVSPFGADSNAPRLDPMYTRYDPRKMSKYIPFPEMLVVNGYHTGYAGKGFGPFRHARFEQDSLWRKDD